MKIVRLLPAFIALPFVFASMANASEHQIPVAPDEYLKMENPYAGEADEDLLKQAGKLYKRKCKKCHGSKGDGKGSSFPRMTSGNW